MSTAPPDDLPRLRALGRALAQATDPATCRHLLRRIRELQDAPAAAGTAPPDAAQVPAGVAAALPPAADLFRRRPAQLARLARRHALGALVSALTHELSQPLSAIGMYSNAAAFLVQTGGDLGELTMVLRQIETQVRRAAEMLARVRAFARQGDTDTRVADLCQSITDALALVGPLAADKQVRVIWESPAEPVWVAADRTWVALVVLNLVCNGIEAMAQAASAQERRVSVSIHPEPAGMRVTVRDTGPGISPGARLRIFDGLETDKPDGCGLGLAISRALIEGQGGQLWADAGASAGAALHLWLPVPPEAGAAPFP